MAVINATKTGNWSDATVWPGSVYPTSVDDVYANTYTITIDQDINVKSVNTTQGTGGTAGGGFTIISPFNLKGDVNSGTTTCLTLNHTTGTVNLTGNVFGSTGINNDIRGINNTSTGNLYVSGNVVGGGGATNTGSRRYAIRSGGINRLDILGDVYCPLYAAVNTHNAITCDAASTVSITGNCYSFTNNNVPVAMSSGGTLTTNGILLGRNGTVISTTNANYTHVGTISSDASTFSQIIFLGGTGNFTYNGNITNNVNTANSVSLISMSNTVNGTISGNLINLAGTSGSHRIITKTSSGTLSITGNLIRGGTGQTVQNTGGIFNLFGNLSAINNLGNSNVSVDTTGVMNLYGDVKVSTGSNAGGEVSHITLGSVASAFIYGDVYGGFNVNNYGIRSQTSAVVVISGRAIAGIGNGGFAVYTSSTGPTYIKRIVGNGYGIGSTGIFINAYAVTAGQNSPVFVEEVEHGPLGHIPSNTPFKITPLSTNLFIIPDRNNSTTTLVSTSSLVIPPTPSDVRAGVVYDSGNKTGTLIVPSVSSVALNIPVDNTVGTAVLTQEAIWNTTNNTLTANSLSATIGYKLNNVATTQTVGSLIAAYNS